MCVRTLLLIATAMTSVYAQRLQLYEGETCKRVGGVDWTCKKIRDCPKAQEALQQGRRPETCGFSNNQVIVCCEPQRRRPTRPTRPLPTTPNSKPTQPNRGPSQVGVKSKEMCKKYAESVFIKIQSFENEEFNKIDTCANVEPLIVGGRDAQPREFPHMALIGYGDKDNILWKCAGSLISERWVLSAAHCTLDGEDRPKLVRLGEYNYRSKEDEKDKISRVEDVDIIQTINHPQYDNKTEFNDIALYKLSRDVTFGEYIRPVCLQTDLQIPKKYGLITGWGRTEFGGKMSDILQKGNVTFMSGTECRNYLNNIAKLDREVRDALQICAANFLSNTDTCQGDSGGPLQYRLREPYCMYSQVGITSYGIRCASAFPAVYTRVSNYISWIESIVWP
ncbi:serine protease snake-like [Macrosteles quadrilineatus]|uniref:serine protease snake-like n=1 Tax=Macrosteles quadrilineatus TaxID=74068 RepID=UPI0023E13445|nr:serine protease snake-like [Macrosteles quadrilineatus]